MASAQDLRKGAATATAAEADGSGDLQRRCAELEAEVTRLRAAASDLISERDHYRALFELAPTAYLRLDRDGRIVDTNVTAAELLGSESGDLAGDLLANFIAPDSQESFERHRLELLDHEGRRSCELCLRTELGWREMHVVSSPVEPGPEGPTGFRSVLADITARKRAEQQLAELNDLLEARIRERSAAVQEREERLNAVLETAPTAIVSLDPLGCVDRANAAAERLFGVGEAGLVGTPFGQIVPEFRTGAQTARPDADPVAPVVQETEILNAAGSRVPVELAVARIDHRRLHVVILRDLSETRQLLTAVLQAAESERLRIASELHDGVAQHIAAIAMTARASARRMANAGAPEADVFDTIAGQMNEAIGDIRRIVQDLPAPGLGDADLASALARMAERVSSHGAVTCHSYSSCDAEPTDEQTRLQLLRIASEAVHNAWKHADAARIDIYLGRAGDGLRLSVIDDGRGIDEAASEGDGDSGVGLRIMEYRARLIGAALEVEPAEGGGTRVRCTLPGLADESAAV